MEIQISFQRKKFSKETEAFLCSRLDKDTEAHLINNLRDLTRKYSLSLANTSTLYTAPLVYLFLQLHYTTVRSTYLTSITQYLSDL